jgi:hypothetical protein
MPDIEDLVIFNSTPPGDTIVHKYEFKDYYPRGQISKVEIIYRRGIGYELAVSIDGKRSHPSKYHDHDFGALKTDLKNVLTENHCHHFRVRDLP